MACYPSNKLDSAERPQCGPTDPNLYAIKADATEEVVFPEGIKDNGNGTVTCILCEKELKYSKLGLSSHIRSAAHQAAIELEVIVLPELKENDNE